MIDLNNLIDLFPQYFKENDSYKDSSGKGLLEKFLNICGDYLQVSPIADLDGYLESLKIENIDELYINSLWDFLGQFPFLRSAFFDERVFKSIFNGSNYEAAKEASKRNVKGLLDYTNSSYTIRELLPKVIAFYKIRGTNEFFQIIFRVFNITSYVEIKDKYSDLSTAQKNKVPSVLYQDTHEGFTPKYIPHFDEQEKFDKGKFDTEFKCHTCMTKFYILKNLPADTELRTSLITAIINLIREFVPFYLNPYFILEDSRYDFSVSLTVESLRGNTLVSGVTPPQDKIPLDLVDYFPQTLINSIPIKISLSLSGNDPWNIYEKGYFRGELNSEGQVIINTRKVWYDEIITIDKPGEYYFVPVMNYGKVTPQKIVINQIITSQKYYLNSQIVSANKVFTSPLDRVTVQLKGGNLYESLLITATSTTLKSFQIESSNIYLGEKPRKSELEVDTKVGNSVELDWPGEYTFYLYENWSTKTSIKVEGTEAFNELLNTPTLYVEPLNYLYVRNNNYEQGTQTYTNWAALKGNGVKGVYYPEGSQYKPHDYSLEFYAKDIFDNYLDILINGTRYTPRVSGGKVTYYKGNTPFSLNRDGLDRLYIFSVPGYPKIEPKYLQVYFIDDVIQPTVHTYNKFSLIPNNNQYSSSDRYKADTNDKVQITVEAQVIFSSNISKSDLNKYSLYALVTSKASPTSAIEGTLSGDSFMQGTTLYGYLVELRYVRTVSSSYQVFRGSMSVNIKALGNGSGLNYQLYACPVVKTDTMDKTKLTPASIGHIPANNRSLYVQLLNIVNYLFFIPDDSSYWKNKVSSALNVGYKSATFDYTGASTLPTVPPKIQVWTQTTSDGQIAPANFTQLVDGEGHTINNIINEYDDPETLEKENPLTLDIPLLALTESSKTYKYAGAIASGTSVEPTTDTKGIIEITLKASPHSAYIKVNGSNYTLNTNRTLTVDLAGEATKNIECTAYSNRVNPPYRIIAGTSSINTDAEGKFTLPVRESLNGQRVFLDLNYNNSYDSATDPGFTLLVTDSSVTS